MSASHGHVPPSAAGRAVLRRRRDERGASAVELALVFPLVFAVMMGTLQYGLYFWGRSTAAASAREAARRMAVGTDWTCTEAEGLERTSLSGRGAAFAVRYDRSAGPVVGDLLQVTVTMRSAAPTFLPLAHDGMITEVARSRVENVPAVPLACS